MVVVFSDFHRELSARTKKIRQSNRKSKPEYNRCVYSIIIGDLVFLTGVSTGGGGVKLSLL